MSVHAERQQCVALNTHNVWRWVSTPRDTQRALDFAANQILNFAETFGDYEYSLFKFLISIPKLKDIQILVANLTFGLLI